VKEPHDMTSCPKASRTQRSSSGQEGNDEDHTREKENILQVRIAHTNYGQKLGESRMNPMRIMVGVVRSYHVCVCNRLSFLQRPPRHTGDEHLSPHRRRAPVTPPSHGSKPKWLDLEFERSTGTKGRHLRGLELLPFRLKFVVRRNFSLKSI